MSATENSRPTFLKVGFPTANLHINHEPEEIIFKRVYGVEFIIKNLGIME